MFSIHATKPIKDGSWSEPVNMGKFIKNHGAAMARVTLDSKYLFYNDRNGDYWWVSTEILEELKPEELK